MVKEFYFMRLLEAILSLSLQRIEVITTKINKSAMPQWEQQIKQKLRLVFIACASDS